MRLRGVGAGLVVLAVSLAGPGAVRAAGLATAPVVVQDGAGAVSYDGVVEAVRRTVVAAQVAGPVTLLAVQPGDPVRTGQLLLRVDARAADQYATAAAARGIAAGAAAEEAARSLERQRQLVAQGFISQAALDRAVAAQRETRALTEASHAAAGAARAESAWFNVHAPYAGVVAEVPVVQGEMALPGRPLLVLYDPAALRVTVQLPEAAALRLQAAPGAAPLVELAGNGGGRVRPLRWQLLPAADPSTHSVELRLALPPATATVPGRFARVWLPAPPAQRPRLRVPLEAVVRRAELAAVYVVDADARALLRQVRLGPVDGALVEVLAGLEPGERVALDPQAAARQH